MSIIASDRRASTASPIEEILAMRWSPRAFDPEATLSDEQVTSLLEAARWASSAQNSQPTRFVVGRRGTAVFDRIEQHLMGFNRAWAPNASALVLAVVSTEDADGKPLRWAEYDAGQAMANLAVQAHALGLHVHPMGGIEVEALREEFDLPQQLVPITVTAVGTVGSADSLPDRYRERESAQRTRLPLADLLIAAE